MENCVLKLAKLMLVQGTISYLESTQIDFQANEMCISNKRLRVAQANKMKGNKLATRETCLFFSLTDYF
jgi:hypothetical protein